MGLAAILLTPFWLIQGIRHGKYLSNLKERLGLSFPDRPLIVVVETISGRSGNASFSRLASGRLANTSPTDTACSQIAAGLSTGSFSSAGNDNPNRSFKFERYLPCRMP